jgi:hypothetical protein
MGRTVAGVVSEAMHARFCIYYTPPPLYERWGALHEKFAIAQPLENLNLRVACFKMYISAAFIVVAGIIFACEIVSCACKSTFQRRCSYCGAPSLGDCQDCLRKQP